MRKFEFSISKQNNVDAIKYVLGVADVYDDRAADKSTQMSNIVPLQYIDEDGKRSVTSYAHEDTNLATMMKTKLSKKEVLCILSGLTSVYEIGAQGIPISYIVKDTNYVFVNKDTLAIKCMIVPIKQDVMPMGDIPIFFREIISNMMFDEADSDNYVAKVLTCINAPDFAVAKLKQIIDDELNKMGIVLAKDGGLVKEEAPVANNVKVNKLGVMSAMANQQSQMMAQPGFMGQQPMMNQRPPMPNGQSGPMGQQPMMNQRPPMPNGQPGPMGQQPMMNQRPPMPSAPAPAAPQAPKPVAPSAPAPAAPQAPKPVAPQAPQPAAPSAPAPAAPQAPKPVAPSAPAPAAPQAPQAPKPVAPSAPAPAAPQAPKPVAPSAPAPAAPQAPQPAAPSAPAPQAPKPVAPAAPQAPKPEMPSTPTPIPRTEKIEEIEHGSLVGQLGNVSKPVPHIIRKKTGETIYINKPEFAIGKSKTKADYPLEDNSAISRVHCIIVQKDGVNYLKDNNSTNHTFLNGVELEPGVEVLLKHKSVIQMGDEEFTFLLRKGD